MPGLGAPIMDYAQLMEDHRRALDATPHSRSDNYERLPAYAEATKNQSPVDTTEKEILPLKQSSKMSALKSIFESDASSQSGRSSSSTWKSILTGGVHNHHPMYRLEESVDPSVRSRGM